MIFFGRMLKQASNFVLGHSSPCDVPKNVRLGFRVPCGRARDGVRSDAPGVGG